MCNIIVINNGEIEIETPQDFIDYFKEDPIKDDMYSEISLDCCLCQIDVEASLKKLSIDYTWEGMDYNITTNSSK
ncbi:hypothetical protein HHL23_09520 [Chryseobacterium sp. RP-3-3]|uniref:Uncharacterized protein n=1 Tax=Chryseobacterium antibioticum TaxID=2728847 RepID=A0A7Y0AML0_9FLAO|nr:hypothetical protein [Chryseobacterium antibioticum]NML70039.1 hypothetical protein [Chryseobacterium antibioticum]